MRSHTLVCLPLIVMVAACEPAPTATAPPIATQVIDARTQTSAPIERTRQPSITATSTQWETTGGGQVAFSVDRNGQDYDVHITSYQFKDRHDRFTVTPESGQVHRAISAVMRDQGRIVVNAPGGPPTGSWTTLRFSDGEHTSTFKDVVLDDDLRSIYDYVTARIRP